jgi:uncharacterized secreted protein with C-terminal beta-propeller domain
MNIERTFPVELDNPRIKVPNYYSPIEIVARYNRTGIFSIEDPLLKFKADAKANWEHLMEFRDLTEEETKQYNALI